MPEHPRIAVSSRLLGIGLLLILVAAIFAVVRSGWTVRYDQAALRALAPPAALVPFVQAVTWLGTSTVRFAIAAALCLVLVFGREGRRALLLAAVVVGGAAFNSGLKLMVARPRPDLLEHLDHVTSASFPSGHSAGAITTYLAIALLLGRGGLWPAAALIIAVLIGLSRVALAVHWPSDVLAGWCVGLAWVLLWQPLLARRPVDRR